MPYRRVLCRLRIGLAALLVSCSAALLESSAVAEPLRILCIGDSITQGGRADRAEYTYRLPLQRMLRARAVDFDFVGTRHSGVDAAAGWPAPFDPDHEAYYGQRTATVRNAVVEHLAALPPPDVALVHLGFNDDGSDTEQAVIAPLEDLVARLRERNPSVRILIGIPQLAFWPRHVLQWRLARLANRLDRPESRVHTVAFVDWDTRVDTFDGVHPTPHGQEKMAATWLHALRLDEAPLVAAASFVTELPMRRSGASAQRLRR